VPDPDKIVDLLKRVAAPTSAAALGLSDEDENEALKYAHYLRSGFTVTKLGRLLKLW
jgi:glycerol dehydrogenase-like iron-containing ADH family enzyme